MNCPEVEIQISALYDGERVSAAVAEHVASCQTCRQILDDYSHMGAELRLSAAMEPEQLPALKYAARRRSFDFLWARVSIPRFALAILVGCLAVATVAVSLVRAQSRPLWFQFGCGFHESGEVSHYTVAKAGYDDTQATLDFSSGAPIAAALRIKVESMSADDVVLRCRAVPAKTEMNPHGMSLLGPPDGGISLDGVAEVHYKPGESLPIPVEGGGTLYLKGEVLDHQPQIAFGFPLTPPAGKLVLRSPILTGSNQLLGELMGATAIANERQAAVFRTRADGIYMFALHRFAGATPGELNWGQITFKLDGRKYRLLAAAPITGGDQPRPVWVRRDMDSNLGVSLGAGPLPN